MTLKGFVLCHFRLTSSSLNEEPLFPKGYNSTLLLLYSYTLLSLPPGDVRRLGSYIKVPPDRGGRHPTAAAKVGLLVVVVGGDDHPAQGRSRRHEDDPGGRHRRADPAQTRFRFRRGPLGLLPGLHGRHFGRGRSRRGGGWRRRRWAELHESGEGGDGAVDLLGNRDQSDCHGLCDYLLSRFNSPNNEKYFTF